MPTLVSHFLATVDAPDGLAAPQACFAAALRSADGAKMRTLAAHLGILPHLRNELESHRRSPKWVIFLSGSLRARPASQRFDSHHKASRLGSAPFKCVASRRNNEWRDSDPPRPWDDNEKSLRAVHWRSMGGGDSEIAAPWDLAFRMPLKPQPSPRGMPSGWI